MIPHANARLEFAVATGHDGSAELDLARPGATWQPPHVAEYLAGFGMGLADVTPGQLAMFVAARNAASLVGPLEIPVAPECSDVAGPSRCERETAEILERTSHETAFRDLRVPADRMEVGAIGGLEDLPRMFPTQWLLEEVQPEMFYSKLASRELVMPVWQRPSGGWRDSFDWTHQRDLVDDRATPTSAKQHAYLLLDVSRTMNDHDGRGTVARGLALAFLRHGHAARSRLHVRPFTDEVGELSSGVGKPGLRALAQRVIDLPNAGQTRIQTALEQAVRDIRRAGPCHRADIMLISDGISRLTTSPLSQETLHTFILGDLFDRRGRAGTVKTLKEWSETFHRVWTRRFDEMLAPRWDDVSAAAGVLEAALERREDKASAAAADALRRLHDNVSFLLRQWKRTLDKGRAVPTKARAVEDRLAAASQAIRRLARETTPTAERRGLRRRRLAVSAGGDPAGAGEPLFEGPGLWAMVRRLTIRAWRGALAAFGRLVRGAFLAARRRLQPLLHRRTTNSGQDAQKANKLPVDRPETGQIAGNLSNLREASAES